MVILYWIYVHRHKKHSRSHSHNHSYNRQTQTEQHNYNHNHNHADHCHQIEQAQIVHWIMTLKHNSVICVAFQDQKKR